MANVTLDTACLICGKLNRFHEAYWSNNGYYERQLVSPQDRWLEKNIVRSRDHYFCFDNLELLEHLERKREERLD